jgi:hypothetical protein
MSGSPWQEWDSCQRSIVQHNRPLSLHYPKVRLLRWACTRARFSSLVFFCVRLKGGEQSKHCVHCVQVLQLETCSGDQQNLYVLCFWVSTHCLILGKGGVPKSSICFPLALLLDCAISWLVGPQQSTKNLAFFLETSNLLLTKYFFFYCGWIFFVYFSVTVTQTWSALWALCAYFGLVGDYLHCGCL